MRRSTLKVLLFSLCFVIAVAEARSKKSVQASETLEQLDSAANLLMTIADSDKSGTCGITPSDARRLLMAIHPIFDDKRNAAIAALSSRPPGKAIANPKWDEHCLRKCHCGLYASILEGVGEQRLVPGDRAALDHMSSKARMMTHEHLEVCARTSQWFCQSSLLTRLKEDAKNFPDPSAPKSPAPVVTPKASSGVPSVTPYHH